MWLSVTGAPESTPTCNTHQHYTSTHRLPIVAVRSGVFWCGSGATASSSLLGSPGSCNLHSIARMHRQHTRTIAGPECHSEKKIPAHIPNPKCFVIAHEQYKCFLHCCLAAVWIAQRRCRQRSFKQDVHQQGEYCWELSLLMPHLSQDASPSLRRSMPALRCQDGCPSLRCSMPVLRCQDGWLSLRYSMPALRCQDGCPSLRCIKVIAAPCSSASSSAQLPCLDTAPVYGSVSSSGYSGTMQLGVFIWLQLLCAAQSLR